MGLQKKLGLFIIALLMTTFVNAQKKVASPPEIATGKINEATIVIKYGSPSVKGRQIWGELVPFNQVWRAGANETTTFETDKELTIEDKKLPAGKYSFFIIPNKNECIIIFNKGKNEWGAYDYKESSDQIRVTVKPEFANSNTEKLVYNINSNNVRLNWEKWNIAFKVK